MREIIGDQTLILGDCREIMPTLGKFDAVKNQQKGNIARQQKAILAWEARRAEIVALYVNGAKSQAQMAAIYGVSQGGFQKALKLLGLPSKSRGRPGQENHRFKDGTQSTAYRKMIKKDHCNRCGETRHLVIHHRDGVHTNNVPENLEVLCSPCHTSHHKQEWWASRRAVQEGLDL